MTPPENDGGDGSENQPNFPQYPKPKGIPLLTHPKQQAPLMKLAMQMLKRPPVKPPTKTAPKWRKKVKFY